MKQTLLLKEAQNTVYQRSDYTHKYNIEQGRHGWLRLTPAYSVKIVDEICDTWSGRGKILDPFGGTGTTALCVANRGLSATSVDINPFLIWLARAKTSLYSINKINETQEQLGTVLKLVKTKSTPSVDPPKIFNIERWWHSESLNYLCRLKGSIDKTFKKGTVSQRLMLVAFCRTMIKVSNAAFNHQSMSFKDNNQQLDFADIDHESIFRGDLQYVLETAKQNPKATSKIVKCDSLKLDDYLEDKYDLVITSPPYPNRMSYIRELRPYMYWMGLLKEAKEAGEMDWKAVGGTWGVATSRLLEWKRHNGEFMPDYFKNILKEIGKNDKNGKTLSIYVEKYFHDIWIHLKSISRVLKKGAEVNYIVGNSTFYGVLLPVEKLYADMLIKLGFKDVDIKIVRKRNSKKELYEYCVSGIYGG